MDKYFLLSLFFCFYAITVSAQFGQMTLDEALELGLPVVEIITVDSIEPTAEEAVKPDERCSGRTIINATKVPGRLSIWLPGHHMVYSSGDYVKDQSGMTIKIRGNNSAIRPHQKPYKIKLQKKSDLLCRDNEDKYKDKNWLLLREWNPTLNIPIGLKVNELLAFSWTPQCREVNVLMNGDYRGIYLLTEQVRRNPNCRMDVDEQDGFIIERDIYWWVAPVCFESDLYSQLLGGFWQRYTFKYPDEADVTEEQIAYIQDAVNQMEGAVVAGEGYTALMDVESFAAWTLGHDLLGTSDTGGANRYLLKYDRSPTSVFQMGTLWDFDTNFWTPSGEWSSMHDYSGHYGRWLFRARDKAFARAYVHAWQRLSPVIIGCMEEYLDSLLNSPACAAMNSSRMRMHGPTGFVSVEKNVEDALEWFRERKAWLDEHIVEIDTIDIGEGLSELQRDATISLQRDIFDLSGRRLMAPPAKGMYIDNGRKVVR